MSVTRTRIVALFNIRPSYSFHEQMRLVCSLKEIRTKNMDIHQKCKNEEHLFFYCCQAKVACIL